MAYDTSGEVFKQLIFMRPTLAFNAVTVIVTVILVEE